MSALNRGKDEKDNGQYDDKISIFGPSASAALYKRSVLEKVKLSKSGYFDKDYFAYYEDVDLAWRFHLRGFEAKFEPNAIAYHVHSATGENFSPFKAFHIHRNHYYNIIKDAPFFIMLFILIILMPIRYMLLVFSVIKGKGASAKLAKKKKDKKESIVQIVLKSWGQVILHLPKLIKKRKEVQSGFFSGHKIFFKILAKHYAKLKKVIFG